MRVRPETGDESDAVCLASVSRSIGPITMRSYYRTPAGAKAFSEFILGREAQEIIRGFGEEQFGQPLFYPDAGKSEESLGS